MSLSSMLRQRARIEQAEIIPQPDGDVSAEWRVLQDGVPCLLVRQDAGQETGDFGFLTRRSAVGYFPVSAASLLGNPDRDLRRAVIDEIAWRVTGVVRAEGPRQTLLVADLVLDETAA